MLLSALTGKWQDLQLWRSGEPVGISR